MLFRRFIRPDTTRVDSSRSHYVKAEHPRFSKHLKLMLAIKNSLNTSHLKLQCLFFRFSLDSRIKKKKHAYIAKKNRHCGAVWEPYETLVIGHIYLWGSRVGNSSENQDTHANRVPLGKRNDRPLGSPVLIKNQGTVMARR